MRSLRSLAVVLLSTLAVACSGDGPTGSAEARVSGTYNLSQINGQNLPATVFQSSAGRVEVTGGTMVLRDDRSYTETVQLRILPVNGTAQTDQAIENGTFTVVGTNITFNVPASGGDPAFSYSGAVSGGVLTYTSEGLSVTYRK